MVHNFGLLAKIDPNGGYTTRATNLMDAVEAHMTDDSGILMEGCEAPGGDCGGGTSDPVGRFVIPSW